MHFGREVHSGSEVHAGSDHDFFSIHPTDVREGAAAAVAAPAAAAEAAAIITVQVCSHPGWYRYRSISADYKLLWNVSFLHNYDPTTISLILINTNGSWKNENPFK